MRRKNRGFSSTVLIVTALAALAACGSSGTGGKPASGGSTSGGSKTSSTSGGSSAGSTERSIRLARFCDQLDPVATAKALGVKAVTLTEDLQPGQKFAPFQRGPKTQTATSFSCSLGTDPRKSSVISYLYANLTEQPLPTGLTFEKLAQQQYAATSQNARCTRGPIKEWGASTDSWACASKSSIYPSVTETMRAEFGKARFTCGTGIHGDKTARLSVVVSAAHQLCNDVLTKVTR